MIPLYEVWQGTDASGSCWGNCWEQFDRVLLPSAWAKAYAEELAELSKLPTQVRGKNHRVVAEYA